MKYLITVLRYIKGYVIFKGEKGFPERFVNLCRKNGIYLWDIKIIDNALNASVSIHNFKRLRTIAKKSGVKIKITRKIGAVFQLKHFNKRIGLAIGLLIFIMFHIIMNQFVWCIDVSGNNYISKEDVITRAEDQGLRQGTFRHSFNEVKAARTIASSYDGRIPWLSINIKGSMALIELRENNEKISEAEDSSPCNIVADFDGIILSVENYRGDSAVTAGNGVKNGDMLISGVIINEDSSTTYYRAKGKITALHKKSVLKSEEKKSALSKSAVHNVYYTLGVLGIRIPSGRYPKEETNICFNDKRYIFVNGYKLPFYIEKTTVAEFRETDCCSKAYINSVENIGFEIYSENSNSTIVSSYEKISLIKNAYTFTGEYTLIDFIGKEKPILSDKLQ